MTNGMKCGTTRLINSSLLQWRLPLRHRASVEPRSMVFIIFISTLILAIFLFCLLLISFFVLGNDQVVVSIFVSGFAVLYLCISGFLLNRLSHAVTALMLIIFYVVVACVMVSAWSINVPAGILMLAFTIILAGVLLGVRWIIPITIGVTLLLVFLQFLTVIKVLHPDTSSLANDPDFGDVASYGTIFVVFALVMWLSQLRLEHALQRALDAEQAVEKEKRSLARRLAEKTRHLKEAQIEEMRQLYRFSELGQSSIILLHELANQLTAITLDVDALNQRHKHSRDITQLKASINQLDEKIRTVRLHIKEHTAPQHFIVQSLLDEVVTQLARKSQTAKVTLKTRVIGPTRYVRGDPQRLFQVLMILVTNAIEASRDKNGKTVLIELDRTRSPIKIRVTDYGVGISSSQRRHLFKPFKSTKKDGMGIGLFIAKQIIEVHMGGTLRLDKRSRATTFTISLPEDT